MNLQLRYSLQKLSVALDIINYDTPQVSLQIQKFIHSLLHVQVHVTSSIVIILIYSTEELPDIIQLKVKQGSYCYNEPHFKFIFPASILQVPADSITIHNKQIQLLHEKYRNHFYFTE